MRIIILVLCLFFSTVFVTHAQQLTPKNKGLQPTFTPLVKKQLLQKTLTTFADKVKAERIARINTLLFQINQTQTTHFLDDLATLTVATQQLRTLLAIQTTGKNITNVTTDIKTATDTIENAKQAILLQQKKDYTLTITRQNTAKTDIQKTKDVLYNDLHTLQKEVTNAKHTVTQALDSTSFVLDETHD